MKVLFVIDGLGTGGAERSLAELLPPLRRAGIATVVVCLHRRDVGVQSDVVAQGFDVRFLRGGRWFAKILELRRIIQRESPTVVHTVIYASNVLGRAAAAGTGAKVITSLVNTYYDDAHRANPAVDRWKLGLARLLDVWTSRLLTDHFHAITNAVAEAAGGELGIPRARITVIERGRDEERLGRPSCARRLQSRDALGIDEGRPVLIAVGRQEHQKGHRHLLDALALLAERPEALLLHAGRRGRVSDELDARADRLGLAGRVRFLGYRDDVPELLAAADLFVFPSLYEGLGGALLEAMALGLPIVSSDLPAVREILDPGRNALLVPAGDAPALAQAIRCLLDDPGRARAFGLRSRQIFEERFTLNDSVQATIGLYRRVVTASPAAMAT